MSKQTGYVRNIFFSIIVSLLVLLSLGFLSIKYLVPIYDLQTQDIYRFLIYLLPVLIGLALIEIGSIISSKDNNVKDKTEDLLPKNSYDAPLFDTINDDPADKLNYNEFNPISTNGYNKPAQYSLKDYFNNEVYQKISKYSNSELLRIFNYYEEDDDKIVSPFNEEITNNLFSLTADEAMKAYNWIKAGCNEAEDELGLFNNLNQETINQLATLSQREAENVLDWLNNNKKYYNLENLSENNIIAISNLNDEDVTKALNWINMGCPPVANPNARVFENLDKDTLTRLQEYNSIQVNVGLDYIDDGAPDVANPNSVEFNNFTPATINRLSAVDDNTVNRGLDILDNEFVNNLDYQTIDRLNAYDREQINDGLDFIDNGQMVANEDLPFGEEINNAIRALSYDQAKSAIEYIKNPLADISSDMGDLSNNLEDFLNSELKDNSKENFNFDITLVIFDKENILNDDVKTSILSNLPSYTYVYNTDNNNTAIIFPYEGKESAKVCINNLINKSEALYDLSNISIGYASQKNRDIDARTLINEAYLG